MYSENESDEDRKNDGRIRLLPLSGLRHCDLPNFLGRSVIVKTGVLISGGMDSLALTWWQRPTAAFTIDYGQLPASAEIAAAASICKRIGIPHHCIRVDCSSLGSGDMAGSAPNPFAPATDWWPYRNQLLITLTAMHALSKGIQQLIIGTVKSDGSHRDGTPAFIESMNHLLSAQEGALSIKAPAIHLTTAELIKLSGVPDNILAWAHSCHTATVACGDCRGCNKYFATLEELGYVVD